MQVLKYHIRLQYISNILTINSVGIPDISFSKFPRPFIIELGGEL